MLKGLVALAIASIASPVIGQSITETYVPDLSKPMEFHYATSLGNCVTCDWISAQGLITSQTPSEFEDFLLSIGEKDLTGTYIHFNSPGGALLAAVKLGELIRKSGASTAVAETAGHFSGSVLVDDFLESDNPICASACVFAFAGGVSRSTEISDGDGPGFQKTGPIGVHQFYDPIVLSEGPGVVFDGIERSKDQIRTGILLEYLNSMGVSTDLLAKGMSVAPWEDMYWLTDADLVAFGLNNANSFHDAELVGYQNGVGVIEIRSADGPEDSDDRREFYCTATGQLRLKILLDWRGVQWNPDAGNTIANLMSGATANFSSTTTVIEQSHKLNDDGRFRSTVLFDLGNVDIRSLAQLSSFGFEVSGTPMQQTIVQGALGITLPEPFHGFHLLPRLCLN